MAITVPTLALSVVGGRAVMSRHADAREAERVRDRVLVLDRLIDLRAALFAERVAVEILVPARRPPDAILGTTTFGASVLEGTEPLARATDEALARLDPADRPFTAGELAAVRAQRDVWDGSSATIRAALEPFSQRTERKMSADASAVRATAVALGNEDLIAAGTTFQRSIRLPDAAGLIFAALSDLWSSEPSERASGQSEVAAAHATFNAAAANFAASITDPRGRVAEFWSGPMQIPEGIQGLLADVEAGGLSSPDRPPGEPASVGLTLLESVDWTVQADALPRIAADVMIGEASDVASAARSGVRVTAALVLLAIAISVAVAILFGRSIVMPVRRLTRHARHVGRGDLTVEPLPLSGPPDVAAAAEAFNDVVGTLRLLEAKSRALADIELEHPALREPLPGRLGAALQRSTEVLSTSIVERENLRSQLHHDATHDPLTMLANRSALLQALTDLRDRQDLGGRAAVVFIDLDGFKQINDRQGHGTGDVVLQVTAQRIAERAPAGSTVARLGGDEFVVLVPDARADEPADFARSIVAAVADPIAVDDQSLSVRACAGVASIDDPATPLPGPADLLQRADLAVYAAKQAGPGTVVCYDEAFGSRVAEQSDVEMALAAALRPGADELRLAFQPIVTAVGGDLKALETLLRWDRRGHGRVPPDEFVPIAERSGLIVHLDMWVLRAAARQIAAWTHEPVLAGLPVSVNVSWRTLLRSDFVDVLQAALAEHCVAPNRLTVEVTETALVTDMALAADHLHRVRELGCHVAIDDFGTGYTSIAHLRDLPVDMLKIDRSFVRRLPNPDDRVLVQMIQDLADLLGLVTVAEGVEDEQQIEILRAIGCDALQGYHYSPALDPGAVVRWARERLHRAAAAPAEPRR